MGNCPNIPKSRNTCPTQRPTWASWGADWQQLLSRVLEWLSGGWDGLMNSVVATVSGVFSGAVTLVMGFMFSFYILYGKEKLGRQAHRLMRTYLKPAWYSRTCHVLGVLDDSFTAMWWGSARRQSSSARCVRWACSPLASPMRR